MILRKVFHKRERKELFSDKERKYFRVKNKKENLSRFLCPIISFDCKNTINTGNNYTNN